jgi:hypothetical protein
MFFVPCIVIQLGNVKSNLTKCAFDRLRYIIPKILIANNGGRTSNTSTVVNSG